MKVINVVQDFNTGGIQKLLLEYLRFFKDSKEIDYKVVVLAPNQHSIFDEVCENEHLKITYLNCTFSKSNHYYIRAFLKWYRFNFRLLRYLKREKPNIVHTHNTRMLCLIETCIKKTKYKYKWSHTLHSDPYAVNESHIPVAKRVFNEYGARVICLNETQFIKAKERYSIKNCLYLYNCFNQDSLKNNIIPSNRFREQVNVPQKDYVIGAVGRLNKVKNYDFLLEVFGVIHKVHSNTSLIISGDGSNNDINALLNKAKTYGCVNKLFLLGNRKDIGNVYNIIDVFVQTSISEASPFTLLEAQTFNKYCVVSKASPKESVCLKNKIVRLGLDEDISVWVKQIISPSLFEKPMSTMKDYSIENVAKKMINIYNEEN